MPTNTVYITAGLPVAKDSGQSPSSGVNTFYVSAGLIPDVVVESGAYSLDAQPGTLNITGSTSSILHNRSLSADAGSIELSGSDATILFGYTLSVDAGTIDITGSSASILRNCFLSADAGAITISGSDATIVHGYHLSADAGSLQLSGSDATIIHEYHLAADAGSLVLTGSDASIFKNSLLSADAGTAQISGSSATISVGYLLSADAGSIVLTGLDANIDYSPASSYDVSASPGSVVLTGFDATVSHNRFISASSGEIVLTGSDASITKGFLLSADAGSLEISGSDATITHEYHLSADAGSIVLSGSDATIDHNAAGSYNVSAEIGSLILTGSSASILHNRFLSSASGTLNLVGSDANILFNRFLSSDAGSVSITGSAASILRGNLLSADTGNIQTNGSTASILVGRLLSAIPGNIQISGLSATISYGKLLSALPGAITLTGSDAVIARSRLLSAVRGQLVVSGASANISSSGQNVYAELVLSTEPAFLEGFWRLNESLGAPTAVDSSPNGNDSVDLFNNTFGVSTLLGGGANTGSSFGGVPTSFIQLENTGVGGPLSAQKFTVTGWFRIAASGGYGDTTTTGTGGIIATPIVAKGRSESDTPGLNLNYFLGITSGGKLGGDFESSGGTNHPITGGTTLVAGRWYFGALTYDQVSFRLYLNGVEDATAISTTDIPDYNTAQPASIATGLTSTGAADGGFNGIIDEVAIWSEALSSSEILALWEIGRVTQPIVGVSTGTSSVTAALSVARGLSDIEGFVLKGGGQANLILPRQGMFWF